MEYSLFVNPDFDAEKAAHVAAFFLVKCGGPLSTTRAVGLIHLANVLSDRLYATPVIADRVAVFDTGPIPQNITALVRGRGIYAKNQQWSALIDQRVDESIWLAKKLSPTDLHRLDARDKEVLEATWNAYSNPEPFEHEDWFARTHTLPSNLVTLSVIKGKLAELRHLAAAENMHGLSYAIATAQQETEGLLRTRSG